MLTCKEFDDFMVDYLGDGLPGGRKCSGWLYVKRCKECAEFVRDYHRTIALGKSAFDDPDESVPATVPEELINAALAHKKSK